MATAPVLFARDQYPELETLIQRRFSESSDVESAFDLVIRSNGLEETRNLAANYASNAAKNLAKLKDSKAKRDLIDLAYQVVNRMK